jgi:putative ABC transport system ATP-binding protein
MNASQQARPHSQTAAVPSAPDVRTAPRRLWRRDWSCIEPPVQWALELAPHRRDDGNKSESLDSELAIRLAIADTVNLRGLSALQRRQLFLVLAGKVRPAHSEMRIADIFVWDLSEAQRRARLLEVLGCATADAALNAQSSVRDNLTLPLVLQDMPHHEALDLVEMEMRLLGLDGRADWMPRHLTASEYRRTVLGRAVIHSPHLLLYEQPDEEMPAIEVGIVRDRLWLAAHEQGCGVLMSAELPQLASLAPTSIWPRHACGGPARARNGVRA